MLLTPLPGICLILFLGDLLFVGKEIDKVVLITLYLEGIEHVYLLW